MRRETSWEKLGNAGVTLSPPQEAVSPASTRPTASALRRLRAFWAERADLLIAFALGLTSLVNYVATLAPTVLGGDSGRWQARAYVLGTGHPTGYPTYVMLSKLFTYLPFGDVAYRVNLASAVFAAVAIALIYLLARRLAGPLPALVAALAFAVTPKYWAHAVIAEVYTLHILLLTAALLALVTWRDTRNDRYLLLTAFLTGLAMTNHMTSGLLIPAAAVVVLLVDRRKLLDWRLISRAALLFLLGLLPYVYLPIRAAMRPPMMYGDPSTFRGFVDVLLGGSFRSQMWAFSLSELPGREAMYWVDLRTQFNAALLVLAAVGFVRSLLDGAHRAVGIGLGVLFASNLIYALEYDIWDIDVYYIPTHLIIALWIAWGVRAALEFVRDRARTPRLRGALGLGIPAVLLVLVGIGWLQRYPRVDQSGNYQTRAVLESVARIPQGGVLYDNYTALPRYLQFVEGRRRDLEVHNLNIGEAGARIEADLAAGRPVWVYSPAFKRRLGDTYAFIRQDNLWRVVRRDAADLLALDGDFIEAQEWLRGLLSVGEGRVLASPHADDVLRRAGIDDPLLAVTEAELDEPSAAPPELRQQADDVRWVYEHAAGDRTREILAGYDVRFLVLVKQFPRETPRAQRDASRVSYGRYLGQEDLYYPVFENDTVVIYEVRRQTSP